MEIFPTGRDPRVSTASSDVRNESPSSGCTWSAVFAGAAAAWGTTLILLMLGAGLGLSSVSPWSDSGLSAGTATGLALAWIIGMSWISSLVGGYITGRLRARWVGVHTHEVFFRDTAHGLLSWTVATFIGVALASSAGTGLLSGTTRALSTALGGATQVAAQAGSQAVSDATRSYDVDTLFRSAAQNANDAANNGDWRAEAGRILARGVTEGDVPAADRTYLAQVVAARTGISQADAEQRVNDVIAKEKAAVQKAKEAADTARKAAARFSLFTALSLLVGAFIASVAAAFGGGLRDDHSH